jgi:tetratricopeptide (TPR) repeat protein
VRNVIIAASVVLVALVASVPALENGFVHDDELLIVNNELVHDVAHLKENLTRDFFGAANAHPMGYYRPLVKLLFVVEYQLFAADPLGYHATSLLLFALCALCALWLARQLGLSHYRAGLAALFFVAHPVAAESVAVITSQSDLLVAIFVFGGFACYLRGRQRAQKRWLVLALVAQLLALASKEVGVSLALFIGLYELDQRGYSLRAVLRVGWLYGVAAVVLAYLVLRVGLEVMPIHDASGSMGWAPWFKRSAILLLRVFWGPGFPGYLHSTVPPAMASALPWMATVVGVLTLCGYAAWRSRPLRYAALLFFVPLIFVLPTSLVHVRSDVQAIIVSDRWLFLSCLGAGLYFAFALGWLGDRLQRVGSWARVLVAPKDEAAPRLIALCVLAIFVLDARLEYKSLRSEAQRRFFVGSQIAARGQAESAYERELSLAARAIRADRTRDVQTAAKLYGQLLTLNPQDYNRRYNYAVALYQANQKRAALEHALIAFHGYSRDGRIKLQRIDSLTRNRPQRAFLVAMLYEQLGQPKRAIRYYRFCLKHNPAHRAAAAALKRLGQ